MRNLDLGWVLKNVSKFKFPLYSTKQWWPDKNFMHKISKYLYTEPVLLCLYTQEWAFIQLKGLSLSMEKLLNRAKETPN